MEQDQSQQPFPSRHTFGLTLPSSVMLFLPSPSGSASGCARGNTEYRLSFNKWGKLRPREGQHAQDNTRS